MKSKRFLNLFVSFLFICNCTKWILMVVAPNLNQTWTKPEPTWTKPEPNQNQTWTKSCFWRTSHAIWQFLAVGMPPSGQTQPASGEAFASGLVQVYIHILVTYLHFTLPLSYIDAHYMSSQALKLVQNYLLLATKKYLLSVGVLAQQSLWWSASTQKYILTLFLMPGNGLHVFLFIFGGTACSSSGMFLRSNGAQLKKKRNL